MLGGFAERVAVQPENAVPAPDDVDDAAPVALLGNYYTMYFALGGTVLVLGSAGGIGTASIQLAKTLGARVIAMVHRPEAMDFVSSL